MFRNKKLLSLILAAVMLLSTVLISSAEETTETTTEAPVYQFTGNAAMFEAEDGVVPKEKTVVLVSGKETECYTAKVVDVTFEDPLASSKYYKQGGTYYYNFAEQSAKASGEKYLMLNTATYAATNLSESETTSVDPEVRYTVNIPAEGTYYVWVRGGGFQEPNGRGDQMWLGTDAKGYNKLTFTTFQESNNYDFTWKKVTVDFTEGRHTIDLIHYEERVCIDKFIITSDASFEPSGKAGMEASVDGTGYATLQEAITVATDDATITLLYDCELPTGTVYDKSITYDLNGHTLNAENFAGYSAQVKDSSAGKGLLKVAKGSLILSSNEYMPVWDDENNGYRFSSITISDIDYTSTDALVFAMRPAFASSDIEKLVAAGHEKGMVRVGVRITWPGSATPYDLPLEDYWLSTMYGGETAKGVKLTISGGETITEFTATTIVWSTQCPNVVIAGTTTHRYPAIVE